MAKRMEIDLKVGLFVTIGVGLIMLAILILGSTENLLVSQNTYSTYFSSVEGLVTGAKVVLAGVQVGTVKKLEFEPNRRQIKVDITVARKYADWIKMDSSAEIATQGVLGDKFIALTTGTATAKELPSGSEIANRPSRDIGQFLSKGDALMLSLTRVSQDLDHLLQTFEQEQRSVQFFKGVAQSAANLSLLTEKLNRGIDEKSLHGAIKNLNGILEKINNGTGTVGALINDPGLYYDAKTLLGGANRNRIIRNLVRQTIRKSEEAEAESGSETPKK